MKKIVFTVLAASTLLTSCRNEDNNSFLDTSAQNYISQKQIDDLIAAFPEKALSVTAGFEEGNNKYMTAFQRNHAKFGYMSILLGLEFMTNDFVATSNTYGHFIVNSYYTYQARNVDNVVANEWIWTYYYKVIYNMNSILKNLPATPTDPNTQYMMGRSLAMRALSYLDLIRLYGVGANGIPYYSQTVEDPSRVPTATIYSYIEADLLQAYTLLAGYNRANKQSINQNVVAGLLARYYMTVGNYTQAANYANIARSGYAPMSATELTAGFSDLNNSEWMWGTDIDGSTSTVYASYFSHISNRNRGYAGLGVHKAIDSRLYNQIATTDLRQQWFLSAPTTVSQYPSGSRTLPQYANVKFYDTSGNSFIGDYVYMRAAEMYFIEAEAYARLGNDIQAQNVLTAIMSARQPGFSTSNTGSALLDEIMTNKRIEMWGEGINFFDHKRWGLALDRTYTGTNHPSFGQLNIPAGDNRFNFQIPQAELDANKNVSN